MLTRNVTLGHSRSVFGFVLLVGVAYWQIVVLGIGGRSVEIWKQGRGAFDLSKKKTAKLPNPPEKTRRVVDFLELYILQPYLWL
jgi:hypothetical protein